MAQTKAFGTGSLVVDNTFAQLTAPGATTSIDIDGMKNHTFAVTVAAIDTDVIVEIEGSQDDTNFFDIPIDGESPVTALAVTLNRATITANGTFGLIAKNTPMKFIRFNFVAENGGTAATIDVLYHGGN